MGWLDTGFLATRKLCSLPGGVAIFCRVGVRACGECASQCREETVKHGKREEKQCRSGEGVGKVCKVGQAVGQAVLILDLTPLSSLRTPSSRRRRKVRLSRGCL